MSPYFQNIAAYIKTFIPILAPAANAAVSSAAISTVGPGYNYLSGVAALAVGAPTGAPTGFAVNAVVNTSADGATNWQQLAAFPAISAANGQASIPLNLRGALGFVEIVATPTFTGGAAPAIPIAATLVLGGDNELPAI